MNARQMMNPLRHSACAKLVPLTAAIMLLNALQANPKSLAGIEIVAPEAGRTFMKNDTVLIIYKADFTNTVTGEINSEFSIDGGLSWIPLSNKIPENK